MPNRTIHRPNRFASASSLIDAVASDLEQIKREDDLTDADIGAALGKHQDQAQKYRKGAAEMGMVAFLRGCERWNGRFANSALGLVGQRLADIRDHASSDRHSITALTKLLLEMSVALEDDEEISDDELVSMKASLDEAGKAIDRMRHRLTLRSVA